MLRALIAIAACLAVVALYGSTPKETTPSVVLPAPVVIEQPQPGVGQESEPAEVGKTKADKVGLETPDDSPLSTYEFQSQKDFEQHVKSLNAMAKASGWTAPKETVVPVSVPAVKSAAPTCCNGGCCKCAGKSPYWFNEQTNQLVKGYQLTEEEAAKKNAILKKLGPNARQPVAAASPPVLPFPNPVKTTGNCWSCGQAQSGYPYNCPSCRAYLPVKPPRQAQPVMQQPVTTFYTAPMQGGCANGQCASGQCSSGRCGTSGCQSRGRFGRR